MTLPAPIRALRAAGLAALARVRGRGMAAAEHAPDHRPRAERCGRCRWWPQYPYAEINDLEDVGGGGPQGSSACHRRAPSSDAGGIWPRTSANDWCGDFEPRPPFADVSRTD